MATIEGVEMPDYGLALPSTHFCPRSQDRPRFSEILFTPRNSRVCSVPSQERCWERMFIDVKDIQCMSRGGSEDRVVKIFDRKKESLFSRTKLE